MEAGSGEAQAGPRTAAHDDPDSAFYRDAGDDERGAGFCVFMDGGRGIDIYGDMPPAFAALGQDLDLGVMKVPWPGIIFLMVALLAHVVLSGPASGGSLTRWARTSPRPCFPGSRWRGEGAGVRTLRPAQRAGGRNLHGGTELRRPDDGVGFELDAIAATVIGAPVSPAAAEEWAGR